MLIEIAETPFNSPNFSIPFKNKNRENFDYNKKEGFCRFIKLFNDNGIKI